MSSDQAPVTGNATHDEVVEKIQKKNVQDLITAVNAHEKVLRARTLAGAQKTSKKALRKMGYL